MKKEAKYKQNDVFFSKKRNDLFIIESAEYVVYIDSGSKSKDEDLNGRKNVHEWLYQCIYPETNKYARYYESRLNKDFIQVDEKNQNVEFLKLLYGV